MSQYTDYVLLAAPCENCDCAGVIVTVRTCKDGKFYLVGGSACESAKLEIDENVFHSILQEYIYAHGLQPLTYEGGAW